MSNYCLLVVYITLLNVFLCCEKSFNKRPINDIYPQI